jgi:hypothetical protein
MEAKQPPSRPIIDPVGETNSAVTASLTSNGTASPVPRHTNPVESTCSHAEMRCRSIGRHSYPSDTTCNRFRLQAKHTNTHSPAAPAIPLSENCRNPNTSLMTPITGSTVHFRSR